MFTKTKIAIVLVGSLIAGVAGAQGLRGHGRGQMIEKFDTNKDGKLDDSEKAAAKTAFEAQHAAKKKEMLTKFDTNKDGKIDDTERGVARDARMTERFKKLDTDGNGQVSLAEFKANKLAKQGRGGRMHHRGGHAFGKGRGMGQGKGTK
ncbi:MAG TPA: EF-hand domain-containing protein [Kofleriaceae bacterium]|nr:EF-hand domain-containing protein [Kofleriaceae bacterium]